MTVPGAVEVLGEDSTARVWASNQHHDYDYVSDPLALDVRKRQVDSGQAGYYICYIFIMLK